MEKYVKCDSCGLTFRDPGTRPWSWTTKDYAGEHYFCSHGCMDRWAWQQKNRKEKKRGWRR